jgi:hypothetical protein
MFTAETGREPSDLRQAWPDGDPAGLLAEISGLENPPDQKIHDVLVVVAERGLQRTDDAVPHGELQALRTWLLQYTERGWDRSELDLVVCLGAVLLLAAEGARGDVAAAELAVLLTHHVGLRAQRTRHTQALIGPWLLRNEPSAGLWKRARLLTIAELLELDEVETLVTFGRNRLRRSLVEMDEPLRKVALGLLASVDQLTSHDDLDGDDGSLDRLAALARALTPTTAQPLAQPNLCPVQLTLIRTVFRAALAHDARTVLLPTVPQQHAPSDARLEALLKEVSGRGTHVRAVTDDLSTTP